MIGKWLFALAKGKSVGTLVGLGFAYGSALIPVKRVFGTKQVIGFYHPKPFYPHHILLVPKKKIRDHFELLGLDHVSYFGDIWLSAQDIAGDLGWTEKGGYVLCSNGGPRQEVMQLHFHLFTNLSLVNEYDGGAPQAFIERREEIEIFHHPTPNWETHLLIMPSERIVKQVMEGNQVVKQVLAKMLEALPSLNEAFELVERGYTLVFQVPPVSTVAHPHLILHVIAGRRRE